MDKTPPSAARPAPTADELRHLPLDDVPALVWALMESGVNDSVSAFHTPSVATAGPYGPSQRTVVLRQVDAEDRLLVCHTDQRSLKVAELKDDPRMSWHVYAQKLKVQIAFRGCATVHTDTAFAEACWQRSTMRSRTCYRTPHAPGTAVAEPPTGPQAIKDAEALAIARSHFAAVACQIHRIDWLYLCARGHRRAAIDFDDSGHTSRWLTP